MKTRKERQIDILTAKNMVYNCQDDFWAEMYVSVNNFEMVRDLSSIFELLESENMLDEAMNLFYLLCLGFEITEVEFEKIYNDVGIKYPFINEFILQSEEAITYLESEIFGWDDCDE